MNILKVLYVFFISLHMHALRAFKNCLIQYESVSWPDQPENTELWCTVMKLPERCFVERRWEPHPTAWRQQPPPSHQPAGVIYYEYFLISASCVLQHQLPASTALGCRDGGRGKLPLARRAAAPAPSYLPIRVVAPASRSAGQSDRPAVGLVAHPAQHEVPGPAAPRAASHGVPGEIGCRGRKASG